MTDLRGVGDRRRSLGKQQKGVPDTDRNDLLTTR